jgi:AmiR/NasT family two-component response regulator
MIPHTVLFVGDREGWGLLPALVHKLGYTAHYVNREQIKRWRDKPVHIAVVSSKDQHLSEILRELSDYPFATVLFVSDELIDITIQLVDETHTVDGIVTEEMGEIQLRMVLEVAMMNNARLERLKGEVMELQETLVARKTIERAKGFLMNWCGLSESDAYQKMRTQAMKDQRPLREVAKSVLLVSELLGKSRMRTGCETDGNGLKEFSGEAGANESS